MKDSVRVLKSFVGALLLVLICLSAGCTRYYYQEGKSFEECKKDRADCLRELAKRVEKPAYGDYEFKFMEECMENKGYRLVTEDKLPLRVKRADPDQLDDWRLRGIAGTLEEE